MVEWMEMVVVNLYVLLEETKEHKVTYKSDKRSTQVDYIL